MPTVLECSLEEVHNNWGELGETPPRVLGARQFLDMSVSLVRGDFPRMRPRAGNSMAMASEELYIWCAARHTTQLPRSAMPMNRGVGRTGSSWEALSGSRRR